MRRDLRQALQNAVAPFGTDDELLQVLDERYYGLPEAGRPNEDHILISAVRFMDITGWMVSRDAVIALAQANWDCEIAVEQHFDGGSLPPPIVEEVKEEPDRQELMRQLNSHVDKEAAKRDNRDDSKLTITLRNPGGKADTVYRYSNVVHGTVDFSSPDLIRALNKWRNQIFRFVTTTNGVLS